MSSMRIMITPESLEQRASELRGYKGQQENVFTEVESLIKNLLNDWEGESQTEFVNSYNSNKKFFDQFLVDLERFAKFMSDFATTMRQTEQGGKTKAQALA